MTTPLLLTVRQTSNLLIRLRGWAKDREWITALWRLRPDLFAQHVEMDWDWVDGPDGQVTQRLAALRAIGLPGGQLTSPEELQPLRELPFRSGGLNMPPSGTSLEPPTLSVRGPWLAQALGDSVTEFLPRREDLRARYRQILQTSGPDLAGEYLEDALPGPEGPVAAQDGQRLAVFQREAATALATQLDQYRLRHLTTNLVRRRFPAAARVELRRTWEYDDEGGYDPGIDAMRVLDAQGHVIMPPPNPSERATAKLQPLQSRLLGMLGFGGKASATQAPAPAPEPPPLADRDGWFAPEESALTDLWEVPPDCDAYDLLPADAPATGARLGIDFVEFREADRLNLLVPVVWREWGEEVIEYRKLVENNEAERAHPILREALRTGVAADWVREE